MTNKLTFKDLNLINPIQKALTKQGYEIPTPIQGESIPGLLEGRDLIGIAQTGTGKTAAFTLPILQKMKESHGRGIRTLVLAPTRELAAQIGESFEAYGEFLDFRHTVIFGGVKQGKQVQALRKGVDILVATPGRLLDLMNQGKINLRNIEFFVLDEADRMLDMGFIHDIKKVLAKLPPKKQSLFFSATMSPQINTLAKSLLHNPVHVEVTPQATTVERIKQLIFFVDPKPKENLLLDIFKKERMNSVLIFTRTKHRANKISDFLTKHNIPADAIHGNKSQNARIKAIQNFKSGRSKVLVATDIAARGIDIDNISHVINFELPNEPESYVHRIGRTARAGTDGTAFSFCCAEERDFLRDIEKITKQKIEVVEHQYHSNTAQNATGSEARPPPRQQGRGRNPNRRPKSKGTSGHRGNNAGSRFGSKPKPKGTKSHKPKKTYGAKPKRSFKRNYD